MSEQNSSDDGWTCLEDPPIGSRAEVWTGRPDGSWMQAIGMISEHDGFPLMKFDAVEHMEFLPEPPTPAAKFTGRCWRLV